LFQAIECCKPFTIDVEEKQYTTADSSLVDLSCGDPACATSFVNNLADIFDHNSNPIEGCSSGIHVFFQNFPF